jgi:hypothetical protein
MCAAAATTSAVARGSAIGSIIAALATLRRIPVHWRFEGAAVLSLTAYGATPITSPITGLATYLLNDRDYIPSPRTTSSTPTSLGGDGDPPTFPALRDEQRRSPRRKTCRTAGLSREWIDSTHPDSTRAATPTQTDRHYVNLPGDNPMDFT